ncbi:MAG: glycosyltransferase family 2 protein [Oscillospiraceae bacterium]|nr:glycosyltransferase family 2 protein [Oscillospiraceae bacterium]
MDKKVSIIVPIYHVAHYLEKCVTSILEQTYTNIQLILVDDGGEDECPAICDRFVAQDDRVLCIHKENAGQSFARRSGVEKAVGDYIMFVDGDDWLEPSAVEESVRTALEQDADVVCFGYRRVYEKKVFDTPIFPNVETLQIWEREEIPELRRRIVGLVGSELANVEAADRMAPMWGRLYKKKVVAAGKWVSEREVGSSEDALFNLYALSACDRFVYINKFLYCYRKSNEQATTHRYRKKLVSQWQILFDYFGQYVSETNNNPYCEEALSNRIALSLLGIGLNELLNPKSFLTKSKNLRNVLKKPRWRSAYNQLEFQYFSLKWKVFFILCKYRATEPLLLLLWFISVFKSKTSK